MNLILSIDLSAVNNLHHSFFTECAHFLERKNKIQSIEKQVASDKKTYGLLSYERSLVTEGQHQEFKNKDSKY